MRHRRPDLKPRAERGVYYGAGVVGRSGRGPTLSQFCDRCSAPVTELESLIYFDRQE